MDTLSINTHSLSTSVMSSFDWTGSIWKKKTTTQTYSFSACQDINVVAENGTCSFYMACKNKTAICFLNAKGYLLDFPFYLVMWLGKNISWLTGKECWATCWHQNIFAKCTCFKF